MATKASTIFPLASIETPEVTQAELDQSLADAKVMIKAVEDAIAELKAKAPDVSKATFDKAIEDLETSIAALPTNAMLDAVKADVTAVQDKFKTLETDKADKTAVEAANTAIKAVDTALKALAALPADVTQAELDAAIADYTKKLKTADDAIAAASQSILSITPVGAGKTLDLNSIKTTGAGFYNGASLAGGPSNAGSGGSGCWAYSGDAVAGTMYLIVWSAPDLRLAEGSWIRSRVASAWGEWTPAPKASDFQVTTGNRDVTTGENVAIAVGHTVNLTYTDATKTIKLKPAGNATWGQITQYTSGFTVPAKPASGAAIVELKVDPAKGVWTAITTVDPLDARMVAVEAKATANETAIGGLDTRLKKVEGVDYNLNSFRLDNGKLFVAAEPIGIGFVHLRSDGQIEVATDAVMDKPANGFVDGPIATGGSKVVYGSGARISDIGSTGVNANSRIFLSKSGKAVSSNAGTGRYIQNLGVYTDGYFLLDFSEIGTWVG